MCAGQPLNIQASCPCTLDGLPSRQELPIRLCLGAPSFLGSAGPQRRTLHRGWGALDRTHFLLKPWLQPSLALSVPLSQLTHGVLRDAKGVQKGNLSLR